MDDFESQLNLGHAISALIDSLTVEFGADAESHVAALRKQVLAELTQDLRFQSIAGAVYKTQIALRTHRRAAQKPPGNGVAERLNALSFWKWDARLLDKFIVDLRDDERLIEVKGFALITNQRTRTRTELKAAVRTVSELNDVMFERGFTSDQAVREVEAQQVEQAKPPQYGRQTDRPWSAR